MSKKNKLLTSLLTAASLVLAKFPVLAAGTPPPLSNLGNVYRIPNPSTIGSLEELINTGLALIRPVFILTFGAMILYGAWMRLTSQGVPEKIQKSSQVIIAAIIGFAIAVFAPTIVDFVGKFLGVQGGLITP